MVGRAVATMKIGAFKLKMKIGFCHLRTINLPFPLRLLTIGSCTITLQYEYHEIRTPLGASNSPGLLPPRAKTSENIRYDVEFTLGLSCQTPRCDPVAEANSALVC